MTKVEAMEMSCCSFPWRRLAWSWHRCPPPLEYRRKSCGQSYGAAGMDGARNGAGLRRGRVAGSKDA
ncbi:MAG TPA: hypothetical protein IAC93_09080 [Candidatus Limisoma gallistercoris]|nr:hypothetical protein [Candidatus Limisoma gallistercoris]